MIPPPTDQVRVRSRGTLLSEELVQLLTCRHGLGIETECCPCVRDCLTHLTLQPQTNG